MGWWGRRVFSVQFGVRDWWQGLRLYFGGKVAVEAGAGGGGAGGFVLEFYGTLADDAGLEAPGAFDFECVAMAEGGGAVVETGVESGQEFVVTVVEGDFGRDSLAFGGKLEAFVRGDLVGVGAESEEVGGGFDGGEAGAGDEDGSGVGKAFDGGAHGAFELQDLG